MARVVYGVSGEGSGHSSRAREVMRHLVEHGHEVKAVSYDRGYRDLKDDFDVFETEGLRIRTVENKVSVVKTFTDNLSRLSEGVGKLRQLRRECFLGFEPEVVITDFEPMTAYLANHYDLPLVTIDNQHRMRYMRYPCPEDLQGDARVTELVIRAMVPRPDVSLVTTFYFGETLNDRTFLFPPILRREVLAQEPRDEGYVLVYCTQPVESLLELLRACPRERFAVYGFGREGHEGNLSFHAPSRAGFLDHLAGCKAVVATAGFTLMTEALYLAKPVLALPMAGQFEQELNALLLAELGCGKNGRRTGSETLGDYLYRLPDYAGPLAAYPRADNRALLTRLDELVADGGAGARAFRARRAAER